MKGKRHVPFRCVTLTVGGTQVPRWAHLDFFPHQKNAGQFFRTKIYAVISDFQIQSRDIFGCYCATMTTHGFGLLGGEGRVLGFKHRRNDI